MAPITFRAMMVGVSTSKVVVEEEPDICSSVEVLRFLQTHKYGNGLSAREQDRIYRRAKAYWWMADGVFKMLLGGAMVVVPRPTER